MGITKKLYEFFLLLRGDHRGRRERWRDGEIGIGQRTSYSEWHRNMYILMVSLGLVYVSMMMVMPFLPVYLQEIGVDNLGHLPVWLGVINGAPFLTTCLVSPLWGRLSDRWGRKVMIIRSGLGMAISTALMSLARSPWELLLFRLADGLFSGFMPASVALMAVSAPSGRTQYALGMLQTGLVIGVTAGPLLGGWLSGIVGHRATFRIVAVALLMVTLVVVFAVRETRGGYSTDEKQQYDREGIFSQSLRFFRHRALRNLLFISFLIPIALYGSMSFVTIFVKQHVASPAETVSWTGIILSTAALAAGIASPIAGRFGDRWGSHKVLSVGLAGATVFLLLHAMATGVVFLWMLRIPLGLFMAGIQPSLGALLARVSPQREFGAIYGVQSSATSLGQGLGPVLLGLLAGLIGGVGGIQSVFIASGLMALFTLIFFHFCVPKTVFTGEKGEGIVFKLKRFPPS
ncbi:MFS transporter [Pasteuria penetrans]|uniref:MFS transporter n=1 Tax=Pasteuria penetrans TaxID=86005 RepID=UPI000F98C009|nr:MFS transporter [Pasteuria penetrans]